MVTFAEAQLDAAKVLQAIVLGGNTLASRQGARKQRRRVPQKQERLVLLVAENGQATLNDLTQAYEKEWAAVAKRRKGQPRLLAKREFFRNIADLAGRINAALVAGYEDQPEELLNLTRGAYLGFTFNHQDFTVTWTTTKSLGELKKTIPVAEQDRHVPLTQRPSRTPFRETIRQPDPAPEAVAESPLEVTVYDDPITGAWTFELHGRQVEVERTHGFVKIDGQITQANVVKSLEKIEDLAGPPLAFIQELIDASEARKALEDQGLGE